MSSGRGPSASDYINRDSLTIDWKKLSKLIAGAIIASIAVGWSIILNAVSDAVQMIIGGVTGFIGEGGTVLLTSFGDLVMSAWMAPLPFIRALGTLGSPVALAITLAALGIYLQWRGR